MADIRTLAYKIPSQLELNFSYMPFIREGGLFVPTNEVFTLRDKVTIDLILPGHVEINKIEGIVVWITPSNALYSIYPGVGIQFIGDNAKSVHELIKANLDTTMDVGGYTYGMLGESKSPAPKKIKANKT